MLFILSRVKIAIMIENSEIWKEKIKRIGDHKNYFYRIMGKLDTVGSPIGIQGYTPQQERLLVASFAACAEPQLLQLSECSHRAVMATAVLYFEDFDEKMIPEITYNHAGEFFMFKPEGNPHGRFFVSYGYNNWTFIKKGVEQLDCKPVAGMPYDMPTGSLKHLDIHETVNNLSEIDKACPKRTRGVTCNIAHVEATVLNNTIDLFRNLGIAPATKTILTTTWTPCTDCFSLILQNKEVYGTDIDVFSIYSAIGDEDDARMNKAIKEDLDHANLGNLHGPYINIPKNPGYGWYPAREQIINDVRSKIPMSGLGEDQKIKILLSRAFNLLHDLRNTSTTL